jgi:predicted HD phosphohydrolase
MTGRIDDSFAPALSAAGTPADKADLLLAYMQRTGGGFYDRTVTQLQHALQCAHLARGAGGDALSTTAALLHDLGHFLLGEHDEAEDFLAEDLEHETVAADILEEHVPDEVLVPIRLHVPAKRYLCGVEPDYYQRLSEGSKRSLALQGGPMSAAEVEDFQATTAHLERVVSLRRWDDGAKVENLDVPSLAAYREDLLEALSRGGTATG